MKKIFLFLLLLVSVQSLLAQTTVFLEDFQGTASGVPTNVNNNTFTTGSAYSPPGNYTFTNGGSTNNRVSITSGVLILDASTNANVSEGVSFPLSNFSSPYNTTLLSNPGVVTWTFNMRKAAGTNAYSSSSSGRFITTILVASSPDLSSTSTTGYMVAQASDKTYALYRFSQGVNNAVAANYVQIGSVTSTMANATDYGSFRVTYDPATGSWSLFFRNDGTSGFADPSVGVTTQAGTSTVDATYTGTAMSSFGFFQRKTTSTNTAMSFDNFKVTVAPAPLASPTALTADPISSANFTANWTTVLDATGYQLDVYTIPSASDLFISEYVEGSSNNKYIEIFNGTGGPVDLSNYSLRLFSNGSSTPVELLLNGILANGGTVIYKNSAATVYSGTATSANSVIAYNGDDAFALYKVSTSSYVDIIGRIGEDPGTEWVSGTHSTFDKTLVRKSTITGGITINPLSGFPTLTTEWDVYNTDDVSRLGVHVFAPTSFVSGYQNLAVASNTKDVSGLSSNTTYYYRVRATGSSPTSSNSNVISVTTLLAGYSYYYSKSSGDLTSTTTWGTNMDGTGTNPTNFSDHNQVFKLVNRTGVVDLSTAAGTISMGGIFLLGETIELQSAGKLTIKSDVDGTGTVGAMPATSSITGDVTVERFIGIPTAKRAWRLLTTPLRGTVNNTIYNTWQMNGAQTTGSGTLITGPGADPVTNGLDVVSGHSLKTYNGTDFTGVDNTRTAELISAGVGTPGNNSFFLFVRGDRSSLTDLTNVSQTTLKATGQLQSGDQTFTTLNSPDAFTLVGNPFASPVDFDKFRKDNGTSNIKPNFYYWDPNLSGVGGYVTVTYDGFGASYSITNSGTRFIQSGQAIFVQTKNPIGGTASVTFKESQKSFDLMNNAFRVGNQLEKMEINLKLQNQNGSFLQADGVIAKFNNNYSTLIGNEDAQKWLNIDENLGIVRDGQTLSVEGRPLIEADDTLFLSIGQMKMGRSYKFEINPIAFNAPSLTAYLEDAYAATVTPVSLSTSTIFDFTTLSSAPLSYATNRFRIVFKEASTLPINYTSVKAYQKNAGIQVDWNVAAEKDISKYDVEKSADGRNFDRAGSVSAKANNNAAISYNWFDASPLSGNNFYRIKAIENDGTVKYSEVVRVNIGKGKSEISIYPNPVIGNSVSLQFTNQVKGKYTVNLINNLGQNVFTKTIEHTGGSATQTISLGAAVSKGVYQLQVVNGEVRLNQKVIRN